MIKKWVYTSAAAIVATYFLVAGLVKAELFFMPLVTAIILALLMIPVAKKMESRKIGKTLAALLSVFMVFVVSLGFYAVVFLQIKNFVNDWGTIKESLQPKIEQLETYVAGNTPFSVNLDLEKSGDEVTAVIPSQGSEGKVFDFLGSFFGFVGTFLLVMIYIFFLIRYRARFQNFLLKMFPAEKHPEIREVIHGTSDIVQNYLWGRLMLIGILAVFYAVGLGISGVDNFILVAIISALLQLIPYLGNIIAMLIAISLGYVIEGETAILIGILVTFGIAQFIESYILEPYVIGNKVDLHPFMVILSIIVGNFIWGIMGMILAIPILGIIHVLFAHIKPLEPVAYLLAHEKKGKKKK
jgi:predicted PurR-regulated permease PerM